MEDQSNRTEHRGLAVSVGGNLVIGLFTIKVAGLLQRGDDERFPMGYAFFEPLINGLKGTLVLGLSIMAFAGATQALSSGGRVISPGPATACWILAAVTRRGARRTESPMLLTDAENWRVNAAISEVDPIVWTA